MMTRNYATALATAGLAALLLTACGSGGSTSAHPAAATTTSPASARAASTVTVTDQEDSNWAGYLLTGGATTQTSYSAVSGSWTQPAADCGAGSATDSAFWVGLGGYSGEHLEQTGTSADCSASGQDCHILSLADFGSITFTGASASAGGRTGSITSGLGQVSALTLEANPGFGRLYATASQADASPGALSGNGSSFTITWQRPALQMLSPPVIVSGPIYN